MKTNKKVILGFAMAMIFSLALMQGVATTSNKQDVNLQQVSIGAGYMAGETEGGDSGAWGAVSTMAAGTASGMATVGVGAAVLTTTNPVGWGYWAITGVVAL